MLDKFAEQLRKARLKKGISLQQIAAKTRIDLKFLEAIDNGNFGFLPDLYVKAFIKQYAKAVDLDEQETIKKYDEAKSGKAIVEDEPKSLLEKKIEIEKTHSVTDKEKQIPVFNGNIDQTKTPVKANNIKKKIKIITYPAGIILIGIIVLFAFFNRNSTIDVEELPYEKVLQETENRYEVKKQLNDSSAMIVNYDSLTLQFTNVDSLDSAWVMVIFDNKEKKDFLLYPNSSKTIRAQDNFKFTLGNSGVIILKLDNELLNLDGKRGSVRHYEVTSNGIQRLNSPPILKIE